MIISNNSFNIIRTLFLLIMYAFATSASADSTTLLTAKQIMDLFQANRQQYMTFEVRQKISTSNVLNTGVEVPLYIVNNVWLMNQQRQRIENTFIINSNASSSNLKKLITVSSPQWIKILSIYSQGAKATINRHNDTINDRSTGSLADIIWGEALIPSDYFTDSTVVVTHDKANGYYRLERKLNPTGGMRVLTIAPSLGYMPVKLEYIMGDGKPFITYVYSDFRKVDGGGLLPFKWESITDTSSRHTKTAGNIESIRINTIIHDKDIDVILPSHTQVTDNILGIRYEVDDNIQVPTGEQSIMDNPELGAPPTPADIRGNGPPATDRDLEEKLHIGNEMSTKVRSDQLMRNEYWYAFEGFVVMTGVVLIILNWRTKQRAKQSEI